MLALTNELTRLEVEESGTQVVLRMIGFAGDKMAVYLDTDQVQTLYTQLGNWFTRDEPFVSDVV
jgi:hypothetical protein